ncbi:MAG: 2,6-dihydroxypyridine 3-hydroxylase [Actinobacteria bacterium]|nr:2,6-dihydroxypyridine 3-hydroxylase [Actinomycetota bacterium]
MRALRVAVLGGSIAGLNAALALRDVGCDVDVYERSPRTLEGLGTGIVVQPELVRYFLERTEIGLDRISVASNGMRYYAATDETLLGTADRSWRFTSYNALYQGLVASFGTERYHLGMAFDHFEGDLDGPQASAVFESGEVITADLVVCADGAMSRARRQLFEIGPEYAGYITWRGLVERDGVDGDTWAFFDDEFTYGLLPDGHLITYPIPSVTSDLQVSGRRLNWQWYWNTSGDDELDQLLTDAKGVRQPVSVHNHALPSATLNRLHRRAADQLGPHFRDLVLSSTAPFVTIVADSDVPAMHRGRIVLVGDAGVTPRPHAAAGAAKAAADGWELGAAIASHGGDVDAAIASWEPRQLGRARAYLAKVRRMAGVLQHGGPFAPGDPQNFFGLPDSE